MSDQKFYKGLYKNKKDALKASFCLITWCFLNLPFAFEKFSVRVADDVIEGVG